ncbi:hypothetical protein LBMAG56_42660 [Verrucomicrobiota bacterium]|nr:hypothetical protein LBMAG56_42660 [Verrucomicrobiota bacterium]
MAGGGFSEGDHGFEGDGFKTVWCDRILVAASRPTTSATRNSLVAGFMVEGDSRFWFDCGFWFRAVVDFRGGGGKTAGGFA